MIVRDDEYKLELCVMLQQEGIYMHLYVKHLTLDDLQQHVEPWLAKRKTYLLDLWQEV